MACTSKADVCADAWYNKGESLLKLQHPADALKAFDLAIQKKKDHYFAWTNKGKVLLNTSPQEALKAFEKALVINPKYEPAIEGRRKALRRL